MGIEGCCVCCGGFGFLWGCGRFSLVLFCFGVWLLVFFVWCFVSNVF